MAKLINVIGWAAGLAAVAAGGFFVGRAVQRTLNLSAVVELYEVDETQGGIDISSSSKYLQFDENGNISFVEDITKATPITLENALKIKAFYKNKLGPTQRMGIMSAEDAQLLAITQVKYE